MAFLVAGCAEVSHALVFPDGFVVYVGDRPYPGDFDPYYNQPKIYRQPRYYTSTSKKTKGKKSVQDDKGEGPIRSYGLQKDDLSQEEKEEIAPHS